MMTSSEGLRQGSRSDSTTHVRGAATYGEITEDGQDEREAVDEHGHPHLRGC